MLVEGSHEELVQRRAHNGLQNEEEEEQGRKQSERLDAFLDETSLEFKDPATLDALSESEREPGGNEESSPNAQTKRTEFTLAESFQGECWPLFFSVGPEGGGLGFHRHTVAVAGIAVNAQFLAAENLLDSP